MLTHPMTSAHRRGNSTQPALEFGRAESLVVDQAWKIKRVRRAFGQARLTGSGGLDAVVSQPGAEVGQMAAAGIAEVPGRFRPGFYKHACVVNELRHEFVSVSWSTVAVGVQLKIEALRHHGARFGGCYQM